jgi:hypothetical protein
MKQVIDSSGNVINGLFRNSDNSLIFKDDIALSKSIASNNVFTTLNNEVQELKEQMNRIMEMLNDSRT